MVTGPIASDMLATNSPGATCSVMPSSTIRPPNRLVSPSTASTGAVTIHLP